MVGALISGLSSLGSSPGWGHLGSISAAHSCPIYVPPRKETAGRMSGKPCL